MAEVVIKPIYLIESLGEYAVASSSAILDIGAVLGPTFFVDSKPLVFADGTSTDGSGPVGFLKPGYQTVYENSDPAEILLEDGKNIRFISEGGVEFVIEGSTADLIVDGFSFLETADALDAHLHGTGIKHDASQISITTGVGPVMGDNVEEAIQSIGNYLANLGSNPGDPGGGGNVNGYEHLQMGPSVTWTIMHNANTKRIQVTVWDANDELLWADNIKVQDLNTVVIKFHTPVSGRAILMLF